MNILYKLWHKGVGHCSAIGVSSELPLRDQMPNLSPQWLILQWIGQVGKAKSLCILNKPNSKRHYMYELTSGQHRANSVLVETVLKPYLHVSPQHYEAKSVDIFKAILTCIPPARAGSDKKRHKER